VVEDFSLMLTVKPLVASDTGSKTNPSRSVSRPIGAFSANLSTTQIEAAVMNTVVNPITIIIMVTKINHILLAGSGPEGRFLICRENY
jgi:hypothetical protein